MTKCWCASKVLELRLFLTSHTRSVLSSATLMMYLPLGWNSRPRTQLSWPIWTTDTAYIGRVSQSTSDTVSWHCWSLMAPDSVSWQISQSYALVIILLTKRPIKRMVCWAQSGTKSKTGILKIIRTDSHPHSGLESDKHRDSPDHCQLVSWSTNSASHEWWQPSAHMTQALEPLQTIIQVGWLSSVLRPRQHSIGYMGDCFYRSKDPTNSIKVLKEDLQKNKANNENN